MQNCYITSTRTTHKDRKDEIIGPCGPCSFINLIGLNGSFKLEKNLANQGRLKPFYASNFTSFLIWAKHYKKKIGIYTQNLQISDKAFQTMFKYEKIPASKQNLMKKQCLKRFSKVLTENKGKVHILKEEPIIAINKFLKKGYHVVFKMADYFDNNYLVGHFRVCYQIKKGMYHIKDSREGELILSRKVMKKHIQNLKELGGTFDLIVYLPK